MNLFRRKSVTDLQSEASTDNSLKRVLGPLHLVMLGVGCTIGTGIFVLTGTVAARKKGRAHGPPLDLDRERLRVDNGDDLKRARVHHDDLVGVAGAVVVGSGCAGFQTKGWFDELTETGGAGQTNE